MPGLPRNSLSQNQSLRILRWNCHSLANKIDPVGTLFQRYDVLALSETWLSPGSRVSLRGFEVFRRDSLTRNSGGLLLAVRHSVPYSVIDDCVRFDGGLECMAMVVHYELFDLAIVSVYRHPQKSLSKQEYDSLFAFCDSFTHVILLGDFNAHHSEWGCDRSSREGVTLLSSALDSSFTCINDGSHTFLTRPGQSRSAIDLSFVSPPIIDHCEWNILEDTHLSDHYPIEIRFNHFLRKKEFFSHKIRLSSREREQFVVNLGTSTGVLRGAIDEPSLSGLDKYETFLSHLRSQLPLKPGANRRRGSSGRSSPHGRRASLPAPWWSEACQEAVDLRRELLSTFKGKRPFQDEC